MIKTGGRESKMSSAVPINGNKIGAFWLLAATI